MKTLQKVLLKLWNQWFIFGMGLSILLAYFFPQVGLRGGVLHPEITISYVAIITLFLITGMGLKIAVLKNALRSWKHQLCESPSNLPILNLGLTKILLIFYPVQLLDEMPA